MLSGLKEDRLLGGGWLPAEFSVLQSPLIGESFAAFKRLEIGCGAFRLGQKAVRTKHAPLTRL